MDNNSVTVRAYLVNGDVADIVQDANPKQAIEYFYPDSGAPVRILEFSIIDSNGKQCSVSISPAWIEIRDIVV
jgi:hypothetical protein